MNKAKVLFLSTANAARSQMAEAYLRKHGADQFEVYSAGLEPTAVDPLAIQVLEEAGLDLSGHRAKSTREYLGHTYFGFVISVCADAEQNCPAVFLTMGRREHWPLENAVRFEGPAEAKLEKFRAVRDEIEQRVLIWIDEQSVVEVS